MQENVSLKIQDLSVEYKLRTRTVQAVNHVNLTVEKKQTLGLVGETGAGKTTLALAVMRLLPERTGRIANGDIVFDGTSLLSLNEHAMQAVRGARIAMIFQDPMTSLNPVLTVGEQIYEALYIHNDQGKTQAELEQQTDKLLSLVGISPERKKQYPHEFSGGMKQRVVIAMALACSPELLIADEPTTALDVTIQAQVLEMMAQLKQSMDMSMILITHDLGIVARVCDKVAVMYAGEIVEEGTFEQFFCQNERRHPYTEGLFASIPSIEKRESRLKPIDGMMPDPADLPKGCKFWPRCPKRTERCASELPGDYIKQGHMVKCHLFAEEPK